jgi:hypothetical protein
LYFYHLNKEFLMLKYFRRPYAIGAILMSLTPSAIASSMPHGETFSFVLQKDLSCVSGYAADDASTFKLEQNCVSFDLNGLEASAFQAGVAIGEVGTSGEIRPFWPLVDLVFNTDPRPLPNPAVSPLIFFSFVRDELCPTHYAGQLLDRPDGQRGCLIFDLDGVRGVAVRTKTSLTQLPIVWELSDLSFDTSENGAIQSGY